MDESVYKIIDLVGTSTKSWEDAVNSVVAKAAGSLRDLRIAEVKELDVGDVCIHVDIDTLDDYLKLTSDQIL